MDMLMEDSSSYATSLSTKLGFHLTLNSQQAFPWLTPTLRTLFPGTPPVTLKAYEDAIINSSVQYSYGDVLLDVRSFPRLVGEDRNLLDTIAVAISEVVLKVIQPHNPTNIPVFFYVYSVNGHFYTLHVLPDQHTIE